MVTYEMRFWRCATLSGGRAGGAARQVLEERRGSPVHIRMLNDERLQAGYVQEDVADGGCRILMLACPVPGRPGGRCADAGAGTHYPFRLIALSCTDARNPRERGMLFNMAC